MSEILAVAGDYRVRLERDWDAENPRERPTCVAHVITIEPGRSGYEEVDSRGGGPLEDAWSEVLSRGYSLSRTEEIFTRWARVYHHAIVVFYAPIEGPRTLWYVLPSDMAGSYGVLAQEMWEYADWLHGEVYRYILERITMPTVWMPLVIGSGLIGYDYAKGVALAHLQQFTHDSHDGNTQP